MHECSKWQRRLIFCGILLFAGLVRAAGPAVLIEDAEKRRQIETVDSETQGEADWNREDADFDDRAPASVTPADNTNLAPRPEVPVLVPVNEDDGVQAPYEDIEPVPRSTRRRIESFQSLSQFRMKRRMGVGASFMGRAGFVGLDAELNLHPSHSLLASVGGGPGYRGSSVGYKWTPFEGSWHPTASLAFANWNTDDRRLHHESAIPAFFRPNPGQPDDQAIQQLYLVPALGLQALKISGESVGGMVFVEFLFFAKIPTFALSPIGSVGAKFFF